MDRQRRRPRPHRPGRHLDDRERRRLPRRRRQALRARRPDRRPVLRGLHAHAVPGRLARRQVRPPHDHRHQPDLGRHRDDGLGRHHRPRRVHRGARDHRSRRGRVLLQRPLADRRGHTAGEAQPRHGRGDHRPGARHHDRDRLRPEPDRVGHERVRGRRGLADAVPGPRRGDARRRRRDRGLLPPPGVRPALPARHAASDGLFGRRPGRGHGRLLHRRRRRALRAVDRDPRSRAGADARRASCSRAATPTSAPYSSRATWC